MIPEEQARTLREAIATVFRLTGAASIEIHSGDREPGEYISRAVALTAPAEPLCRCPTNVCLLHPSLTTCGMRTRLTAPAEGVALQEKFHEHTYYGKALDLLADELSTLKEPLPPERGLKMAAILRNASAPMMGLSENVIVLSDAEKARIRAEHAPAPSQEPNTS